MAQFINSQIPATLLDIARAHAQNLLFACTTLSATIVSLVALLTYPPYYEDESWTFIAVFEAARGNLFSWGSFDEGQAIFSVAHALALPFSLLSPWGPEETVRIFALSSGLLALLGVYLCARRIAPEAAWLAPAVLVATPIMFPAMRYGRLDVEALMLASLAMAAAAYRWPLIAGAFSGLAFSAHPVYLWLGFPCLALAYQDGPKAMRSYVMAGVIGVLPQALWTMAHFDEHREIWVRYADKTNTSSLPFGFSSHCGEARSATRSTSIRCQVGKHGSMPSSTCSCLRSRFG